MCCCPLEIHGSKHSDDRFVHEPKFGGGSVMDIGQWLQYFQDDINQLYALVYGVFSYGMSALFFVIAYCFQSKGLSSIARRRGIEKPWLAWLPLGNLWILGCISDQYQMAAYERVRNKRRTLLFLSLLCGLTAGLIAAGVVTIIQSPDMVSQKVSPGGAATGIGVLTLLVMALVVVLRILEIVVVFDLYRSADPFRAMFYLVLGIVVYVAQPFLIFSLRNKDKGIPLRKVPATFYQPPCEF